MKGLFRVLLIAAVVTVPVLSQKHVVYPTVLPPPHTPQEVLLLFSGNTADERILLTLNNNRPDTLTTSITVYTASGIPVALPDITMVPQESKLVELSPLLQTAGLVHQELGWIKLDYSGVTLEMGAQLTLYPEKNGPGVDSPRSLSSDFKSTERDAVFWMPEGAKARLSLTNGSPASIFVKTECGTQSEEFVIPAKSAKVQLIDLPEIGPIIHSGNVPYSCEIVSDGAIDALRPVGTVLAPGYSAPIRFYDPKTATFSSLTAVGLDTSAATHVTVHNVTGQAIEFVPILREAALTNPRVETLAPYVLGPHGSVEVALVSALALFEKSGIARATLTLKTAADKGAFVGAVTQTGVTDHLVEDIPLRTSNPPAFARGSYPLRWSEDYTNLVTVTNTAEETLRIGGEITAGGAVYVLTREDIAPGATKVFDVDEWKRSGVPDINGKTIPKDAPFGKFHWIEMSYGKKAGLLGRTSLSSVTNRRRSSFSCGSTCEYNYQQQAFYDLQLLTSIPVGGKQVSALTEYDSLLNGQAYTYPVTYYNGTIRTSSSSVVSLGSDPSSSSNVILYGNTAGTATLENDFFDTEYSYDPDYEECDENQVEDVQDSNATVYNCPTTVTLAHAFSAALPSRTNPSSRTGIGILTQMLGSPSVSDYTGAVIYEVVTPATNSCPANVKNATDLPYYVGTFTIGDPAYFEGVQFASAQNVFYDQNVLYSDDDVLANAGTSSCTATGTQVYSCNNINIGTFTITNTYNHGILNGQSVTNVTVQKQ